MEKAKLVRLDGELHKAAKVEAAKRGITIIELVALAVKQLLGQ
jgi:predicted HicB family RNase H-like nuclease